MELTFPTYHTVFQQITKHATRTKDNCALQKIFWIAIFQEFKILVKPLTEFFAIITVMVILKGGITLKMAKISINTHNQIINLDPIATPIMESIALQYL